MKSVLGLILAFDNPDELQGIGDVRTAAALPIGCRYRAVDFMLSSMTNSGITTVGVVLRDKYQSLLDHIGTGRDWDLSRKLGGLVFLPPFSYASRLTRTTSVVPQGKMEALAGIYDFLALSRCEYVVMADGDIIANLPLDEMVQRHKQSGWDVTVVCVEKILQSVYNTYYALDESGRVTDYNLGLRADEACRYTSLGVYIMKRSVLLHIIDEAVTHNCRHLERDTLPYILRQYTMGGEVHHGFATKLQDVRGFFDINMMLLQKDKRDRLFDRRRPILTRVRNEEPTYYGDTARVSDSLLADGCTIEGTVENSIIFRNVRVGRGAVVRDSIVMKGAVVKARSEISHVIADKEVTIREDRTLIGHENYPVVVAKHSVI